MREKRSPTRAPGHLLLLSRSRSAAGRPRIARTALAPLQAFGECWAMRPQLGGRRPAHATVVAYLALFCALGGSAVAASGVLIKKPSQVGKGVITSKALKDHAAVKVKDLTRKALATLQTPGPKGDTGPRGEK